MKIHEYQAKELFRGYGIPVPPGRMVETPEAARDAAAALGGTVAVKAQVHVGGRGKAGGIKIARTPDEAEAHARAILGMDIKGSTVRKLLIEKGAEIQREAYVGLLVDRGRQSIGFIASAEGGIEIEEVAVKSPDRILRFEAPTLDFPEEAAAKVAGLLFEDEATAPAVLEFMRKLFKLFVDKDASLAEINPLVLTAAGEVIALDGKINFDDNALFRQADVLAMRDMHEESAAEIDAKEKGLSYVDLDGDIGCMVNGAGLAMATMDMIQLFGGRPANFLDVGGSSNPEKVVNAFRLILDKGGIKAILINIFGGITRCDDIARGILTSLERIDVNVPVVCRLTGTNAEEGRALLEGTPLVPAETFSGAVKKAIELAKGVSA